MKAEARAKVNKRSRLASACSPTPSSRRASRAGWSRSTARSTSSSPTRSRATRSATTPTRTCRKHPWRHGRREARVSVLREVRQGRAGQRLRAQGTVPAVGRAAVPASASPTADVRDVGKAAKDWPQLNFIIYHSAYRFAGGGTADDAGRSSSRPGASSG